MGSRKRKALQRVYVYFMELTFYIPTVVRQPSGVWREALPVHAIPLADIAALADAVQAAREGCANSDTGILWDGMSHKVWEGASLRWSLLWWDDGTLAIAPLYFVPLRKDPATGDILDGGWADDKERTLVISGETPAGQVARLLVSFVMAELQGGNRPGRVLKIIAMNQEHLGSVFQSDDGSVSLDVVDERFRNDLEALLARIRSEPLYLTTGERSEEGNQVTFTTRRKHVRPGDADFLAAVQELLRKVRFGETRVRGLLLRGAENHEP